MTKKFKKPISNLEINFVAATSKRYNPVSAVAAVIFQITQVAHHTLHITVSTVK